MTKKWIIFGTAIVLGAFLLNCLGCASVTMTAKELEASLKGVSVTIRTFDEQSQVIDRIKGKSVMIERDETFDTYSSDGSNKDSSAVTITIGGHEMNHVGSSLVMAEDGLEDVFEDYAKTVDITNMDRSVPFVNSLVNSIKNKTTGKSKVILIRSQNGTPLATYLGNKVSKFKPDIPKTTVLIIDGKLLVLYRCDITSYDIELLTQKE